MDTELKLENNTRDELIDAYISLKHKKENFEKKIGDIENLMECIKAELLNRAKLQGETGFNTKSAIASIITSKVYSVKKDEWREFYRYLYERAKDSEAKGQDPLVWIGGLLQKRVSQSAAEVLDEQGELPLCVNSFTKQILRITER